MRVVSASGADGRSRQITSNIHGTSWRAETPRVYCAQENVAAAEAASGRLRDKHFFSRTAVGRVGVGVVVGNTPNLLSTEETRRKYEEANVKGEAKRNARSTADQEYVKSGAAPGKEMSRRRVRRPVVVRVWTSEAKARHRSRCYLIDQGTPCTAHASANKRAATRRISATCGAACWRRVGWRPLYRLGSAQPAGLGTAWLGTLKRALRWGRGEGREELGLSMDWVLLRRELDLRRYQ